MITVALLLPCGREFDEYGFFVAEKVLSLPTEYKVHLYIGIKQSNYDRSVLKNKLPNTTFVFESETTKTSTIPANLAYNMLTEDYVITLADDFEIRGDIFGVIKFLTYIHPPIAVLGACGDRPEDNNRPNEITYFNGPHPAYRATPWFAADVKFLKSIFTRDLFPKSELQRWYSDELFAFRIQFKYKCVIPLWANNAIYIKHTAPVVAPTDYSHKTEIDKYLSIIKKIEDTGDLCITPTLLLL